MGTSTARKTFRVAVFIPTECQLLDQACIDVLATMSYEYLVLLKDMLPATVLDLAPSLEICYVGSVAAGETIPLTANQRIVCTHHHGDPAVAPGTLDALIVPGPDPSTHFDPPVLDWLRAQGAVRDTDILSVCTGIFLCGYAGLLEGRTVCGPRGMQDMIKEKFGSNVQMKGNKLRWVQDGNFWSSGGITNGNDLVAAYARHRSDIFPKPLVEMCLDLTDVGDRGCNYSKSQPVFILGMLYNVFRSWTLSLFR